MLLPRASGSGVFNRKLRACGRASGSENASLPHQLAFKVMYIFYIKSPGVASHTSCRFVQIPRLFRSVLAGRLEADNVAGALRLCRPDGVDFNSRLESAPGRKDPLRVTAAVQAVRQACGGETPAGTVCGTKRQAHPQEDLPAAAAAGCGTVRQACGKGRHQ